MAINVFVPSFHVDEILAQIRECLEIGWTGLGFKTAEFEKAWKSYSGLPNAHFINSNTSGLHLALAVFKNEFRWADGDEVITTPLTFVSTNHAILYERLTPVFADVDEHLCLDPASVERMISSRTRAIMFVGIGGNVGQLEAIKEICRTRGIKLILDAAHMAGSRVANKHVGDGCDVTVFSFQAVKNLPTADSGMICFSDSSLDQAARKMSWLGINKDTYERFDSKENRYKWNYDVEYVGFKYNGNSIQAAMGLVQLKYLDADNNRRREIAKMYDSILHNEDRIRVVAESPGCRSSRHLYQILVSKRDAVVQAMSELGVNVGVHYRDNKEYRMYRELRGDCPRAADYSRRLLTLPIHLRLTDQDIVDVCSVLKKALDRCS
jgi:dTDP-4-amino-4,6-dideoxygalactose transaminase